MGRRNQTYGIVHRRSFALNGFLCFFLFSKGRYNYILSEFLFQPKPIILVSLLSLLNTSFSYIGSLSKFAQIIFYNWHIGIPLAKTKPTFQK